MQTEPDWVAGVRRALVDALLRLKPDLLLCQEVRKLYYIIYVLI